MLNVSQMLFELFVHLFMTDADDVFSNIFIADRNTLKGCQRRRSVEPVSVRVTICHLNFDAKTRAPEKSRLADYIFDHNAAAVSVCVWR
jgi:hypothetical protein